MDLSTEQKNKIKKAIEILDGVMEQVPNRKLADSINGLQELVG